MNLKVRSGVLYYSLMLETLVSNFVGFLLGIQKPKETLCFGNTSSALSFNQKVNLLIDIAALDRKEKEKFLAFMEIRNQFMHNSAADSFVSCLAHLSGKDKWLLKKYPQKHGVDREKQFQDAFNSLGEDLLGVTLDLLNTIRDKEFLKNKGRTTEAVAEAYKAASIKWDKEMRKYLENLDEKKKDNFSAKELRAFGKWGNQLLFKLIREELNKAGINKPNGDVWQTIANDPELEHKVRLADAIRDFGK